MLSPLQSYFRTFARYNGWANARLYEACGRLTEAEYMKTRPAFFESIHGVLNHGLVGDRIFLSRFTGREPAVTALDQQLYGDLAGLRVARVAEDAQIVALVDGFSDDELVAGIRFNWRGQGGVEFPRHVTLGSMFNHATHHRGQAHDLISQTKLEPPPLDFGIYLMAERERAQASA